MSTTKDQKSHSVLNALLAKLPIQAGEYAKFLYTAIIMVCTVYSYSILRNAKDAVIVSNCGAELLSAIKLYGVTPCAIIAVLCYTKIIDLMSRVAVYNFFIWFFTAFVCCFAFFLYPNAESAHADFSGLIASFPYLKYLLLMLSNWSFSLFYIFAELYGSMMLSLLFWQTANQITQLTEAPRFYPLFGFTGQIGLFLAGLLGHQFAQSNAATGSMNETLEYIAISLIVVSAIMSFALNRLSAIVGNDVINAQNIKNNKDKAKKSKPGFIESMKHVFTSKYIGLIALLIVCYGMSINLVEGVWKKAVGIEFPDPNDFAMFMSQTQMATSIATALSMLCGVYLMSRVSWRTAAIITPLIIGATGCGFFIAILSRELFSAELLAATGGAMMLACLMGASQNTIAKAIKYSFFDGSKEMSYIVLDNDLKSKGKAAADVIGGRVGKAGGAVTQQILLTLMPSATLLTLAPALGCMFVLVIVLWLFAVVNLSKMFEKAKQEMSKGTSSAANKNSTAV